MDERLRCELLLIEDEDQRVLRAAGVTVRETAQVQRRHVDRLKVIIETYGWPGQSLVGSDAASAAWLIAQHADHDLPFQRFCLGLLRAAVAAGEAAPRDLAMLTDRVLVAEDKPQRYGSQFRAADDVWEPFPIETPNDPDSLDGRRQAVGLTPMAEYARLIAQENS